MPFKPKEILNKNHSSSIITLSCLLGEEEEEASRGMLDYTTVLAKKTKSQKKKNIQLTFNTDNAI